MIKFPKKAKKITITAIDELGNKMADVIAHPESKATAVYLAAMVLRDGSSKTQTIALTKRVLRIYGKPSINEVEVVWPKSMQEGQSNHNDKVEISRHECRKMFKSRDATRKSITIKTIYV